MARKTDMAMRAFDAAARDLVLHTMSYPPGMEMPVRKVPRALGHIANGSAQLAGALKDIYDVLDRIEQKLR